MSVEAMAHVLAHSPTTGGQRLVLLSVANHAHKNGKGAHPGIDLIAQEAQLSRRQVIRALKNLEAGKHLKVNRGQGPYQTHSYEIDLTLPGLSNPVDDVLNVTVTYDASEVSQMSPNPSLTNNHVSTSPLPTKSAQKQKDFPLTSSTDLSSSEANLPYPGRSTGEDIGRLYRQFVKATGCRPPGQLAEERWGLAMEELRNCRDSTPETVFFSALAMWFAWRDEGYAMTPAALVNNWERFFSTQNDFTRMPSGRWQPHLADYYPTRPMVPAG